MTAHTDRLRRTSSLEPELYALAHPRLYSWPAHTVTRGASGFTLIELIIVITIIGILAVLVLPNLRDPPRRAQEVVLKSNLRILREAIFEYSVSEGHLPTSLQALIDDDYLQVLPYDPMTKSTDTWVEIFADPDQRALETGPGEPPEPRVKDVRSGSSGVSVLNGVPYSEW